MKTLFASVLLLGTFAAIACAQQDPTPESLRIASLEPSEYFDFWLGEWKQTWDWERSDDGGQTWQLQWRIRYSRAE